MVSCIAVLRRLSDFLDDDIDPTLRGEIEEHLRHCKRCSIVFDSTRRMMYLYTDQRLFQVPSGMSERLHRALEAGLDSN